MTGMLTLGEAAALLPQARVVGDAAVAFARVHTDTRTLQPGDLILTGTPDGIVDCQPGDVIVTEIEHIGALTNTIVKAIP